jgi:ParB-like chromosome segregation protein Spo0J
MSDYKLYEEIQLVPINSIFPSPFENANELSDEMFESLKQDIAKYGLIGNPIVVNPVDNTIIGGHHRFRALQELGYAEVPVVFFEPEDQIEQRILSIAFNQKHGTFNEQRLHSVIKSIYDSGRYSLDELRDKLGFNLNELKEKLETIKVDEDLINRINQEAMESEKNMPVPMNFILTKEQEATVLEALNYAEGRTKGERLQFVSRSFLYQKLDEEKPTR